METVVNNTAYVIEQINQITGHPPVKKALQKTVFLLEKKGVNLNFNYMLHFYGPYSAELDHETAELTSEGIVQFDYTDHGHKMSISSDYKNRIKSDLPSNQLVTIQSVIERYKEQTPSDLELLTTAIYAYEHTNGKAKAEIIRNVKKIKGEKYNDQEIQWALDEFSYFDIKI